MLSDILINIEKYVMRWLVDFGLMSHQQLRSYGDGTSVFGSV